MTDLDAKAHDILRLLSELKELINQEISKDWERGYLWKDLIEEVWRLSGRPENNIPLFDREYQPSKPRAALVAEREKEKDMRDLSRRIRELERELDLLRERLRHEVSKNWELGYQCRDLGEEVQRLRTQVRNRVSMYPGGETPVLEVHSSAEFDGKTVNEESKNKPNSKGRARSRTM